MRRPGIFLLLLTASAPAYAQGAEPGNDAKILPMDEVHAASMLQCQTYCNSTVQGISKARLTWQPPKSYLDPKLSASAGTTSGVWQRVDVTVYKQGFDKNIYAMTSIYRHESEKGMNIIESKAFQPMYVTDPKSQRSAYENAGQSMQLSVAEIAPAEEKSDAFEIQVEGLTGGVNYFWRVLSSTNEGWIPSGVTRCQALVCPVDNAEDEKSQSK